MHTQSASKATRDLNLDMPEEFAVLFGDGEGVTTDFAVQYEPVYEQLLLRNHPTKRMASVYERTHLGGGQYQYRLLSVAMVDVGKLN